MHSAKQRDPAADAAIAAFLSNGGHITRVAPSAHGTCERKRGIQFRGAKADNPIDPERIRLESISPAERCSDPNTPVPNLQGERRYWGRRQNEAEMKGVFSNE